MKFSYKIIGLEFFMGSLCDRGICIERHRRKSPTSTRLSTESTIAIVCMKLLVNEINIYFTSMKNNLV